MFIVGCVATAISGVFVGALIGFAFLGLSKPVFDVSSQAYISDRVPYARRARYMSSFEFTWSISLLVGAPLAGWLISKTDWATPFWVFGFIVAVTLFLLPRFVDADIRQDDIDLGAGEIRQTRHGLSRCGGTLHDGR